MSHAAFAASLVVLLSFSQAQAQSAEDPISFGLAYTGEVLSNRSGGLQRDSAYVDNLDLTLSFDTDSLFGWTGTEFFVYGLYNNGTKFSGTIVGDAQVVSNIETGVEAGRLYEAWFRSPLGENTELLFGLYDLNSEFDVLKAAQLFPGSAHGIGTDIAQTGRNGPSIFPVAGLGLRISHRINEQWTLRGALIDGVPGDPDDPASSEIDLGGDDGALMIGELEWSSASSRVLTGAWAYSTTFDDDPLGLGGGASAERHKNFGVYLRGETRIYDAASTASVFGRIGFAQKDVNVFGSFFSAGIAWRGILAGRERDEAGLAFAWSETSDSVEDVALARGSAVDSREVAVELTYRALFGKRFALQPTVHYVINPGIDPAIDNAVVLALRFSVALMN